MEALKTYLKEIRNIPLLTAAEEISLSKQIKRGGKQGELARKRMIQSNLRLVINIAKRYMHLGIPLLDLIEEGNLGLMKAVEKFNPKKGYRFSTYAAWWIKQSITRSISEQGKMIRVPVYMNELITKWKKKREHLTQKLKRSPTDEEIARTMKLPKDKTDQISFWMSTKTSSLDAPIGAEEESQVSDLIEDETIAPPDAEIEHLFDKERVSSLLGTMNDREKEILGLRFGLTGAKSYTLAQVAQKLGVSRERIRQIEEAALRKLRKFVEQQENEL
ncbi:MAG: sigma-70 family RNA polymerase sigma factor [Candidatus Omnitrophica bacterium]|nr:sigma-70 family RNA polymerase sigma factor [Candidatus Omnitrophota bacterium]